MTTQFILAYEVGEHTYTCKVDAPTWDGAERHLRALAATGLVSGEYVCDVPEQEPVAWIVELERGGEVLEWNADVRDGFVAGTPTQPLYTTPPDDEALLRQALEALEWVEPSGTTGHGGIHARQQAISALRQRLGEMK